MAFKLPENTATRPIAILGAGTLGRRIALMLATRGAEIRLYDPDAAVREAGVAFAREQLPAVLQTIADGKAGTIVGCDVAPLVAALTANGTDAIGEDAAPDPVVLARLALHEGVEAWRVRNRQGGMPRPLYLRGVNITLPDGARRTVE